MIPDLYEHQKKDVDFILPRPRILNFSDPGTGKTRTTIEAIKARKHEGRTLVLCPKSIMDPAWGNDIKKFAPDLTYSLAYAHNRLDAFIANTDIVIMNHDGITWLETQVYKHKSKLLNNFVTLIVDESTAFKNASQRFTALNKLKQFFKYRILLTGTPYTNSLTDIWRQATICDDGARLGNSFYRFRDQVCVGRQLANGATIWEDKDGMEPLITHLLSDITIRHRLENCVDIPPNQTYTVPFTLNERHQRLYNQMQADAVIALRNGTVTATNAAILANKLLQIASGAVYSTEDTYHLLDEDRYELIRDLALARPQSIIAFRWRHQKEQLCKLIPHLSVIDGTTSIKLRNDYIQEFQNGNIQTLLIHPRSGAHGITLTAGHATIWASPTYSSEEFIQFNHRIYRAGQTKKTETILVTANHTLETAVYTRLQGKLERLNTILTLLSELTDE